MVSREVSLLPRHWEWLEAQPGALRKLVEGERKQDQSPALIRQGREAVYRFMSAMAGDRPHFEEAARSLFAGKYAQLIALVQEWPEDIRDHLQALVAGLPSGAILPGSNDPS